MVRNIERHCQHVARASLAVLLRIFRNRSTAPFSFSIIGRSLAGSACARTTATNWQIFIATFKQDKNCPVWHMLCFCKQLTPMLQLTMTGEYAVRAMIHLAALPPDVTAQIADISREWEVPDTFLRKIMSQLSRNGLVATYRGNGGGVALARPAHTITLLDVIESIEGTACTERMHRRSRHVPSRSGVRRSSGLVRGSTETPRGPLQQNAGRPRRTNATGMSARHSPSAAPSSHNSIPL